jgi:hypothetical protein
MGDIQKIDHRAFNILSEILAVEQLSKLIHKSPASIRSDASRNPSVLPPICRLPGNKRLLWRMQDVLAWLEKYVQGGALPAPQVVEEVKGKRGRPRKVA